MSTSQSSAALVSLQHDGAFVFNANAGPGGYDSAEQNPPTDLDYQKLALLHDAPAGQSLPESYEVPDWAAVHLLHVDGFIIK